MMTRRPDDRRENRITGREPHLGLTADGETALMLGRRYRHRSLDAACKAQPVSGSFPAHCAVQKYPVMRGVPGNRYRPRVDVHDTGRHYRETVEKRLHLGEGPGYSRGRSVSVNL